MKVKTNFFPTPVHVVIVTSSQKSQMFLMASGMVNPLQKFLVTLLTPTRGIMIHGNHKFSSVAQSCLTLCNPMDCSTPGLPVHHQLPVLTQTHVHWLGNAIQPSYPLSSPSPPVFSLSHHQGKTFPISQFFTSGGQTIGASASTSVLPMNIQDGLPLRLTVLNSLLS